MAWYDRILNAVLTAESRNKSMNDPSPQTRATATAEAGKPKPKIYSTVLQHPKLPSNLSIIERIALPVAFNLVNALVRDPQKADELREYFTPLRDALNEAYPEE